MSDSNNGASDRQPFEDLGRANPRPEYKPGRRILGFLVGCVFAVGGLAAVAGSVANFDKMKEPPKIVYHQGDFDDEGGYSLSGGFGPGLGAFFGMLFAAIGTGVAAASATTSPCIRRGVAAILALAWHSVGIGACWNYCSLAPKLDVWPFLMMMAYGWLGLIPLALAIPEGVLTGRLRSAVWYAMGDGLLGGVAGAVIGGAVGGVAVLLSSAGGTGVAGTTWWLFVAMGGGLVTSVSLALLRLTGWEIPGGEKKEKEGSDEEEHEKPESPRSAACRKCRMPIESGLAECPFCGAPAGVFRVRAIGRLLNGVGGVCVVGMFLGWGLLQRWLVGKGLNPTALSYLFWMIFIGGWIMIGIGSLLTSAKPDRGSPDDSGSLQRDQAAD